jgi:transcriptional regulator with XRE-family HTH domain
MGVHETTFSVLTMIDTARFAKELGARIAACRKEQGLSQTQLGELVGQSQQVIADYETGRRRIPACNLASIADALGVSTAVLLDGTERPQVKRGPASRLEQLAAQAAKLPRTRQRFVIEMLENAVARAQ